MRSAFALLLIVTFGVSGCASWVVPGSIDDAAVIDAAVLDTAVVDSATGCALGDGTVCPFGTSCPAGDGCNTCACMRGTGLACTELACTHTCTSNAMCAPGESCSGTPGCSTPWTCQSGLTCTATVSTWCDCAGNTFTTPSGCPGRPINHTGPCETPIFDAGMCSMNGANCRTGRDCCSGYCMSRGAPFDVCAIPPPGMFGCGSALCHEGSEYCELTFSDTPGPDSFTCIPLPAVCGGTATCDCVQQNPCGRCQMLDSRTVSFLCQGG